MRSEWMNYDTNETYLMSPPSLVLAPYMASGSFKKHVTFVVLISILTFVIFCDFFYSFTNIHLSLICFHNFLFFLKIV